MCTARVSLTSGIPDYLKLMSGCSLVSCRLAELRKRHQQLSSEPLLERGVEVIWACRAKSIDLRDLCNVAFEYVKLAALLLTVSVCKAKNGLYAKQAWQS